MAWIKRNLFFFIGGLVALGLLGAAGYYNYTSWSRNSEKFDKLNEIYTTLGNLNKPEQSPGNDKINKTEQSRQEEAQLRTWLDQAQGYFQPIAAIPPSTASAPVTSATFAAALRRTIDTLQHEALAANVDLPPEYAFSFQAQNSLVQFSPGSLDLLAVQLGEVKGISEILYMAGINQYDGIQRMHVSDDDASGPQSDYVTQSAITNGLAIITPYVITFRSFSPEIAQVLAGFAGSPHGFIVKSLNVQPATASGGMVGSLPPPMRGGGEQMPLTMQPAQTMPTPANAVPGKGGMVTVLKEQLLRVSMEVDIIKLLPKN